VRGTSDRAGAARDAARLCTGTLTVFPVRAPAHLDRRTAGRAMALAPLAGLLLAAPTTLLLWLLQQAGSRPLLAAALTIGLLALLTRAMHLDGLADTADGLGSRRPTEAALAIMRKGDVGPFGVVALVLTLLVQVAALASLVVQGRAGFGLVLALVVSRLVLPFGCSRGVPAARPDGLGQVVAGSVGRARLATTTALSVVVLALVGWASGSGPGTAVAGLVGLAAGVLACGWCVHRLGGITGDVLGACVEVGFTVVLVVLVLG
jgi:adenosylcobinamide-GDP ribazoletransferase